MKVDFQRPLALPAGAREIILVRHGAVDPPGPHDLVDGRSDPSLNTRGLAQAAAVGRLLGRTPVTAVLASPLRRTGETAAPLGREAMIVEELIEVYLGEWEGHGIATRAAAGDPDFVAMMEAQRWDLAPGAEPADVFGARIQTALGRLADAAAEGAVIAVTHAGVIAEMCAQITRSEPFAFLTLGNGSLTRIARMPGGRWTLLSFNETSHLEDEASGDPGAGSDQAAPVL